ncbi:hypothetical protein [Rhizobium sp. L1K21]|uniref:hypothetical protein n=1 Tax=Rhizobium sp. L1K21 TaxID=2954933 RepID=UPI002092A5AC|nr:hypothetical protein [Rhizobium sp. L1K21]MCO6186741.1 hypothetical protein [Rhizobium sp. L1K21]
MKQFGRKLGLTLRIICALALLSIGFAQVAQAGNRVVPAAELALYVLPDGSLPDLCITIPDGSGGGKIVRLGSDTMGALHAHPFMPPEQETGARVLLAGARLLPVQIAPVSRHLYRPGSGPRAPPAFLS